MKKTLVLALASAGLFITSTARAQFFADSVVSYNHGTGADTNYYHPEVALGGPTIIADEYGPGSPLNAPWQPIHIVGLGTGGSLTLGFSTPVSNNLSNPYGLDFIIFGHAGFQYGDYPATDGALYTGGTADVRVSVSQDGNTFYNLVSVDAPLVDGLFPNDSSGNPFLPVNPALTAADFAGKDLAGIQALYAGSGGGAGFDLSWAVDENDDAVSLSEISYIRLETLSGTAYVDAISAVPEPAVGSLFLLAGAALLTVRRPKKAKSSGTPKGVVTTRN